MPRLAFAEEPAQRRGGDLVLLEEPFHRGSSESRPEVRGLAARDEDDPRGDSQSHQVCGHVEAVAIRQPDVQEDHIRPDVGHGLQGAGCIVCLTDHLQPLSLEQRSCLLPEGGVVVNDQVGGQGGLPPL
jgi:hypothetical protein